MDWTALRDTFPVTTKWAFLDHAAIAPPPIPARDALCEWARDVAENGSASLARWTKRVSDVRQLAATLLNAEPDDIAFIKNTSEGIGFVAEGFPWKVGDNMVTAAEEYPSNIYPWMNIAERGVEVRLVPSTNGRVPIDELRKAMDQRTRLVSLSFVEFASGFRNELHTVGQMCRERGVYFFVDAIQGLGAFPLNVQTTPVDFLSADGHKWLLGPEGAGIFWIRRDLVDMLHISAVGWNSVVDATNFTNIDFRLKPHAGRWESGAMNVGGISALGASIELLLQIGIEKVEKRVLELTDLVCDGARRLGLEVFSSRRPEEKSGIVSLMLPGMDVKELVRRCREAGIIVARRAGRLRISPHCYNSSEEIEHLLDVLRKWIKTHSA